MPAALTRGGSAHAGLGEAGDRARGSQRGGIIFKFLALCFLVVLAFALYLVRHPLMRVAGRAIVLNDSPRASDAIVILGDDDYHADRATRASQLLKGGWAPRIVASGRYLRPYISIPDIEQHDLLELGVPPTAIVRYPSRARDTGEECAALGQLLEQRGWKHVLLVTSNYHTRRADYICSRVLPSGTELHVIAANDSNYSPDNWWETRESTKIFFHEVVGMIDAAWELRHKSVQTQG